MTKFQNASNVFLKNVVKDVIYVDSVEPCINKLETVIKSAEAIIPFIKTNCLAVICYNDSI